ncbi:MAG: DUF123 domain-containing protein [Phycisphaerae bacterium]|nr:DUF123 domain-containing protein [Phycisphaerae bacterium]
MPKIVHRKAARTDSGVYRLWIELRRDSTIIVGRLGRFTLTSGTYVYVGSARRNLSWRIERHRRRRKRLRWHIDYLLALPHAEIWRVETRPWRPGAECRWARGTRRDGGGIVAAGFGASDCHGGCGAHLFLMSRERSGQA